ncbi:ATP-grasp domain-containing protein [Streptomyces sp. SID5770]|uniref:ATP-grasp domain-containing protein n=1 Tax=Streptomyces sp. SID5770 TaxID=2690308 RepID=UPI00136FFF9B|nr:ATP-grasp domain-containing protein [Streptomyces sp. SID5770]MZE54273.1 ATP-grasp domain-containing protein [Streptomyces sp. SID5770]
MPPHILFLHHGDPEVILKCLEKSIESFELSVITEKIFVDLYPATVPVEVVESVRDMSGVRKSALKVASRHPIDIILSPSERCLQAGGYLRSFFALPGMGYEIANLFSNKAAMKVRMRESGIPIADFRVIQSIEHVESAAYEMKWPLVVKPAVGQGCMDTHLLRNIRDFKNLLSSEDGKALAENDSPIIAERFMPMNSELHCDGIVQNGEIKFASVSEYLKPIMETSPDGLRGTYTLEKDEPLGILIKEMHEKTVKSLGLFNGVTHMEIFNTEEGLIVGEISCRPPGAGVTDSMILKFGVNQWQACIDLAVNERKLLQIPQQPENDDLIVNLWLPAALGKIKKISTDQDLMGVPGVIRVDMFARPGDVLDNVSWSSATTGRVFLRLRDRSQLKDRCNQVSNIFDLEIEL